MPAFHAPEFLTGLCRASIAAAVVVGLVLLARVAVFRGGAARWRTALWVIVLVRFALPVLPASRFSLLNAGGWIDAWRGRRDAPAVPLSTILTTASKQVIRSGYLPPTGGDVPVATVEAPARVGWRTVMLAIWAAGGGLVIARRAFAHLRFVRRLARDPLVVDGPLIDALDEACTRMNVTRAPLLRLTDAVPTPALAGLLRPQLLLPPATVASLSPGQLRLVMLHELAHLRRRDLWVDSLCTLVLAIHWFNPAAWLAAALYRADRELARDAMVIRAAGDDQARDYGRAIVLLLERLALAGPTPAGAVGILERWGGIRQRVRAVAHYRQPSALAACAAAISVGLVGCAALTNRQSTVATQPPPAAKPPVVDVPQAEDGRWAESPVASAQLRRKLAEIHFDGQALGDVVDYLRDATGANVFVNWRGLEAVGVTRESKVSVRVHDVTLEAALKLILGNFTVGKTRLAFDVDENVILISTEAALRLSTSTQTYDVRDLLAEVPDYDNAPSLGLVPATAPAATRPYKERLTRAEAAAAVVKLVKDTVDPEGWETYGRIRELSGQLIVTQTAENQKLVASLLEQLRRSHGVQVMLEVRFFEIDDAADASDPTVARVLKFAGGSTSSAYLDEAQVDELTRSLAGRKDVRQLASPRMQLFNGQHGWMTVATETAYVANLTVVRGANGAVAYAPEIRNASSGVMFDAQATVSADRHYVTLTLHPEVSRLERLEEVVFDPAAPAGPDGKRPMIQRPILSTSSVRTTVNVPDGGTILFGGFSPIYTGEKPATTTAAGPLGTSRVFLLVKPRVISNPVMAEKFPGR